MMGRTMVAGLLESKEARAVDANGADTRKE
jgi:hypothetical protein